MVNMFIIDRGVLVVVMVIDILTSQSHISKVFGERSQTDITSGVSCDARNTRFSIWTFTEFALDS